MNWIFAMLVSITCSSQAFGMEQGDYLERTQKFKQQQQETDFLMRRLGLPIGFSGSSTSSSLAQDQVERKALFKVHSTFSALRIPVGKYLYGKTLTRLLVGPDGAPAMIVLEAGQSSLSGLKVMGLAHQGATEGRLLVEVNKLLLKNGRAVAIQGVILDSSGAYGVSAQTFSGKALAVAGSMVSSFVSGFAASQQTQNTNLLGFSSTQPTGRNGILQGVAQGAADQSKRLIEDATTEKSVLLIENETPVVVLIQEEVRF